MDLLTYVPKVGLPINLIEDRLLSVENLNIKPGGKFSPQSCSSHLKVAIIIPYHHRDHDLNSLQCFLGLMRTFLIDQNIEYGIYLVEPANTKMTFNRGLLMNIGYREALRDNAEWNCFFFHDIDMFPQVYLKTYAMLLRH